MHGSTIATSVTAAIIGTLSILAGTVPAFGYDRPDFEISVFNRDGLSLSTAEATQIATKLVELAANPKADTDLKEKALGLALRIAPLNEAAREADASLSDGASLPPSGDSFILRETAEALWEAGIGLLREKPSRADADLAPFLMEIALTAHPRPDGENVWRLGTITDYKTQAWDRFVKLQPATNPSDEKVSRLLAAAKGSRDIPPTWPPDIGTPDKPPMTPPIKPGPVPDFPAMPEGPSAKIKIPSGKMPTILSTRAGPIPGFLHLDIRDPGEEEEGSLFSLFTPSGERRDTFEMKIMTDVEGIELEGIDDAEEIIRTAFPRWPDRKIAEFSLKNAAGEPLEFPEKLKDVEVGFAAGMLLFQAITGNELSSDFVVLGKDKTRRLGRGDRIGPLVKAMEQIGVTKALVGSGSYDQMLEEAAVTDDITSFSKVQFISVKGTGEATQIVFGKSTIPVAEATAAFENFVTSKPPGGTITQYVRSNTAKAPLTRLVEEFPFHCSAKIMFDYGTKPLDDHLLLKQSISKIDATLKPFATVYGQAVAGEGGVIPQNLGDRFRDASLKFRKMRTDNIPSKAENYLRLSEGVLGAMDKFLTLKNQDTAIGMRRHRELKEAIVKLNEERVKLGFPQFGSGG